MEGQRGGGVKDAAETAGWVDWRFVLLLVVVVGEGEGLASVGK